VRSITVLNGNLFEIAASELGDAMQWIAIARANNLSDPMIVGFATIRLPTASAQYADGIGTQ
jgi:hypothetical protein